MRRARPRLGTLVQIAVAGPQGEGQLHAAIGAAFAAIERVQRLMCYHDPDSELSRLNRQAPSTGRRVDAELYTVLESALRLAALSQGAFDPCIGDRLEQWGYLPPVAPSPPAARGDAGDWRDIQLLDRGHVRFARPVRVDLGGIAKGYAVDRAVSELQRAGVRKILVNAGGDLRVAGPWERRARLRHPDAPQASAHALRLCDSALATSAAYYSRRRLAWGEVSALLDPRTAKPYTGQGSVSVQAADCMSADALTKVVLFAPPQLAEQALAACGARAYVQGPIPGPV